MAVYFLKRQRQLIQFGMIAFSIMQRPENLSWGNFFNKHLPNLRQIVDVYTKRISLTLIKRAFC